MKKENGIINLGAISLLLISTLMISLGIATYYTSSSQIKNAAKNAKNQTNYYTNSTNSMLDDNSDFDLDDYSFGNYTEE